MNELLKLMHDTWGPVGSIKRAAIFLKRKELSPDEVDKLCDMIVKKADELNVVLDSYYIQKKNEKPKSNT